VATLGEVNRAGKYKNCPLDFGQDGHLEWNDGAISVWANMPMWLFWSIHFTVEGCCVPYKVATDGCGMPLSLYLMVAAMSTVDFSLALPGTDLSKTTS
jgi:hypothetical protein